MINNNLELCNSSEKEKLKSFTRSLNKFGIRCPRCNSRYINKNGTYKRKTGHFITIQKYICKECHYSFKELPYLLANYSHLSIIEYLTIAFNQDKSNRFLSELLLISRSSVSRIRKRFKNDFLKLESLISLKAPSALKEMYIFFREAYGAYIFSPPSTDLDRYSRFIPRLSW